MSGVGSHSCAIRQHSRGPDGDRLTGNGGQCREALGQPNQLLSLSFIASLVEFSSQRVSAKGKWIAGTVAPLVLDSPFGQLDETYKQAIATYLPKLADQVVLFVTSSQGEAIEIFEEYANGGLEVISRWISQPYLTKKFEM